MVLCLGSVTKTCMAALTLKLAEEGWFNLSGNGYEDVSLISNNGIYSVLWTSAGLFSTTENLARWCSALFHGQVLNEVTAALILEALETALDP